MGNDITSLHAFQSYVDVTTAFDSPFGIHVEGCIRASKLQYYPSMHCRFVSAEVFLQDLRPLYPTTLVARSGTRHSALHSLGKKPDKRHDQVLS